MLRKLIISIQILLLFTTSLSHAVYKDDLAEAQNIYEQTKAILSKKLNREGAPKDFHETFNRFKSYESEIQTKIQTDPTHIEQILMDSLRTTGLSHLGFIKLGKGTFGFEVGNQATGTLRISKIHPLTPAALANLKPGDIIVELNHQPITKDLLDSVTESLNYSLTVIHEKEIKLLARDLLKLIRLKKKKERASKHKPMIQAPSELEKFPVASVLGNKRLKNYGFQEDDEIVRVEDFTLNELESQIPDRELKNTQYLKMLVKPQDYTIKITVESKETILLEAASLESMNDQGIGANGSRMDDHSYLINFVLPQGPADQAGIQVGDILLSLETVNSTPDKGLILEAKVKKPSGEIQTLMLNTISDLQERSNYFQLIEKRGKKAIYLVLNDLLSQQGAKIIEDAVREANPLSPKVLIIDLRNNPGGKVQPLLAHLLKGGTSISNYKGRETKIHGFPDRFSKDLETTLKDWTYKLFSPLLHQIVNSHSLDSQEGQNPQKCDKTSHFLLDQAYSSLFQKLDPSSEDSEIALPKEFFSTLRSQVAKLQTFLKDTYHLDCVLSDSDIDQSQPSLVQEVCIEMNQDVLNQIAAQCKIAQLTQDALGKFAKYEKQISNLSQRIEELNNRISLQSPDSNSRSFSLINKFKKLFSVSSNHEKIQKKISRLELQKKQIEESENTYLELQLEPSLPELSPTRSNAPNRAEILSKIKAVRDAALTKLEDLKLKQEKYKRLDQLIHLGTASYLDRWIQETASRLNQILSSNTDLALKIPKQQISFDDDWRSHITSFDGKVVFIVGSNTNCAAEMCPQIATEYQLLKNKKWIDGIPYQGQLLPERVFVIGHSKGRAEGAGEELIKSSSGYYKLYFPLFQVHSYLLDQKIEGVGVHGIDTKQDPVEQALELINSN